MAAAGRPPVRREVRRGFWRALRAEPSLEEAAAAAGVSYRSAKRWFAQAGGVIPALHEPTGRCLSFAEREQIAVLKAGGANNAEIARALGRDRSTIGRELARDCVASGGYRASTAQAEAEQKARRPKPAKLATNLRLRKEVQTRLKRNHSPEQITERLRRDFPDQPEMRVSTETIYQSLYVQTRGALKRDLVKHLRTGRAVRKPRRQADQRRGRIPDMVNISERPQAAADRAVPGHWEGDLIIGKDSASAIGTLVERKTRFTLLLHLPDGRHDATTVAGAMIAKMAELPAILRQTLTWDQGKEMTNHAQIAAATALSIYFCDPHSPWQRPTNENTNGLLRQYFPKGTDLSFWGSGYLDHVAAELNNRPRKTLDWQTPAEALEQLLSDPFNPPGVAMTG
jgi:IS30 family transposase